MLQVLICSVQEYFNWQPILPDFQHSDAAVLAQLPLYPAGEFWPLILPLGKGSLVPLLWDKSQQLTMGQPKHEPAQLLVQVQVVS